MAIQLSGKYEGSDTKKRRKKCIPHSFLKAWRALRLTFCFYPNEGINSEYINMHTVVQNKEKANKMHAQKLPLLQHTTLASILQS